ncbi:MAG: M12 family metallo-peptidase [Acidobacteriota bacterium]|nr:M12 family metallo-peptidase [Acidobacteriota bacterium]
MKNQLLSKNPLLALALILLFGLGALIILNQTSRAAGAQKSNNAATVSAKAVINKDKQQDIWQEAEQTAVANLSEGLPADFRAFRLNKNALVTKLAAAPHESLVPLGKSEIVLQLPMPNGKLLGFRIQEAPVLEEGLAERFPEIKSYRALGIDDPTMTGRFDLTPRGFHATVLGGDKTINILPADTSDLSLYASYASDGHEHPDGRKECLVSNELNVNPGKSDSGENALYAPQTSTGPTLRTYRIAISTTYEYTSNSQLGGGTVASTVASINSWLNGINAIYEREVSIRLIMVNDTDAIYTTNTDPYNDASGSSNASVLLNQVRDVLRDQVGEANYNLGHLLARNSSGGVAYLGVICNDSTQGGFGAIKGGGISPMSAPIGNAGSLKLFAHELGHQFGANHTFNGTGGSCAGTNRSTTTSYEPGSGSTIMSYAGICSPDNVTTSVNDLRFHAGSFAQITDHTINQGGAACATTSNTGNNPPTVSTTASYNIPKNTPFTLTATGSDPDTGDASNLTYVWEQYDVGGSLFANPPYNDAGDPANTTRPIFRAFAPTKDPSRTFPSLTYILNNANDPPDVISTLQTAEELPRIGRTLNFRVTARDNAGGVNDASTVLTVDGNSGPFKVTDVAGSWTGGSTQTVTWDVANTQSAPVSAANVKISLSSDGGNTFPTVLAASTDNDGSEAVTVPNGINTTTARIKVEAVGNIFFDISGTNFTVTPGDSCPVINDFSPKIAGVGNTVVISGTGFTGATSVTFSNGVNATFTVNSNTQITATVPAGAVGGSITVSENGCGNVQTSNFIACANSPSPIQIDDGSANSATGLGPTGYFVNRLTPSSYPATLSQVVISFPDFVTPLTGTPITILAGTNTDGDNNINNTSFQTKAATITGMGDNNFIGYAVSPITINSGDFVVGFSVNGGALATSIDTNSPQARSYRSNNGSTFTAQAGANYMIRAQVITGACSGACSYTINADNQNFTGTGGNGVITITTQANCPWSAARNNSWLSLTSPTIGTGSGTLNFSVAANTVAAARSGSIIFAGQSDNLLGQDIVINQAEGQPTAASIAGVVSYGTTPQNNPTKYVPGVLMSAAIVGGNTATDTTTATGAYTLANLTSGGSYTVTPSKSGDRNGITAFDATLVLRCVAAGANCALTPNQKRAANTDGDNDVTAFDATQILRFVAANGQNVNTGQVGNWKFDPANRPYPALNSALTTEHYTAFLIGEIDGDWAATPPPIPADEFQKEEYKIALLKKEDLSVILTLGNAASARTLQEQWLEELTDGRNKTKEASLEQAEIQISLPENVSATAGSIVRIPVMLRNPTGKEISAYNFAVRFDPEVLQIEDAAIDAAESLSNNGFLIVVDTNARGRIGIAATSINNSVSGSGTLVYLNFKVTGVRNGLTIVTTTALSFETTKRDGGITFKDTFGNKASLASTNGTLLIEAKSQD